MHWSKLCDFYLIWPCLPLLSESMKCTNTWTHVPQRRHLRKIAAENAATACQTVNSFNLSFSSRSILKHLVFKVMSEAHEETCCLVTQFRVASTKFPMLGNVSCAWNWPFKYQSLLKCVILYWKSFTVILASRFGHATICSRVCGLRLLAFVRKSVKITSSLLLLVAMPAEALLSLVHRVNVNYYCVCYTAPPFPAGV